MSLYIAVYACLVRSKSLNDVYWNKPPYIKHGCWMLDYDQPDRMWGEGDECEVYHVQRRSRILPCVLKNNSSRRPECIEDWERKIC
jgi:hypothetical protein